MELEEKIREFVQLCQKAKVMGAAHGFEVTDAIAIRAVERALADVGGRPSAPSADADREAEVRAYVADPSSVLTVATAAAVCGCSKALVSRVYKALQAEGVLTLKPVPGGPAYAKRWART